MKKNRAFVVFMAAALLAGSLSLGGCGSREQEQNTESVSETVVSGSSYYESEITKADNGTWTTDLYAMDTYMQLSAYGDDDEEAKEALNDAKEEIKRLDQMLSAQRSSSEIAEINKNGGGKVSEDVEYLVKKSLELHGETDGKFEIAIYPVKKLWGFDTEEYRVPSEKEIQEKLPLADSDLIRLDEKNHTISFQKEGMEIDLGAIAKGYTSSRIMNIFREHNVHGMVNLGGNVQVYGDKPDGSSWRIGIRTPVAGEEDQYVGVLETNSEAVITSGSYERFFEQDGKVYHHIIDPDTGYPADSDLLSVTIVDEDGTEADGLSTSMFIYGKDRAIEFWRNHSDEFGMILLDQDQNIFATEDLQDRFTSDQGITWIPKERQDSQASG